MVGHEGGAKAQSSAFQSLGVSLGYLFPCCLPGRLSQAGSPPDQRGSRLKGGAPPGPCNLLGSTAASSLGLRW